MKKQSGQVLVLLILVMTIALATGLSIIQKSLSDISSASKVEQSSRAFSAAEAGIEKALQNDPNPNVSFTDNSSSSIVSDQSLQPSEAIVGTVQTPLEFSPLAKEDVAQVWLADFNSAAQFYNPPSGKLDVYWGTLGITNPADKPALEVKVIYYASETYQTKSFYLDSNESRISTNGFTNASSGCIFPSSVRTTFGNNRQFYCKWTLSDLIPTLMLARLRILYSSTSQPVAIGAVGTCQVVGNCKAYSIPAQARIVYSVGTSGETQRRIRVVQQEKIVPPYFDYAIFSSGDITK